MSVGRFNSFSNCSFMMFAILVFAVG